MVDRFTEALVQLFIGFREKLPGHSQSSDWFVGVVSPATFNDEIKEKLFYKNIYSFTIEMDIAIAVRDTLFEEHGFIPDMYYYETEDILEAQATVFIYT